MPFDTTCPHCGRVHDAMPDSSSGAMVRCRGCFKPFTALALASADQEPGPQPSPEEQPEEFTPERATTDERSDLRAVVARLADIQRKCGALVTRHPELVELGPALDAVLRDLRLGHGPRGEPLDLRELALPLGSWARRLHRVGLPVVGRELEHVERTLTRAAEARVPERCAEPPDLDPGRVVVPGFRTGSAARPVGKDAPPERRGQPVVLVAGVLALLVAVAVGALVTARRTSAPPQPLVASAEPTPAPPSPTPRPRATPAPTTFEPLAADLSRLVEASSQAQLAAQRGDLDGAVGRLEEAARVDPSRAEVRAAAQTVVDEMTSRAAKDAAEGRFVEAEEQLLSAHRLSERFLLDTTVLESHLQRLRTAERTVRVRASERDRLVAAVGRQVEVRMAGREVREGTLTAVEEGALVIEVHEAVGLGEVAYTVRVPLARVELVVYRYRP